MKYLVTTTEPIYDSNGLWLGHKVIEVDGYSRDEYRNLPTSCKVCGGTLKKHKTIFVANESQSGFGEIDGRNIPCPNQ